MSPILRIKLLGPPEIRWEDQIITISRKKPRGILLYLACRMQCVSREEILNLFWQDGPVSSNRLRLNETLSRLRAALPDADILVSEGDLLGLNAERTWVDAHQFDQLIDQIGQTPWRIPMDQPLPNGLQQHMETALALWHGPHFMVGDALPSTTELDNWLTQNSAHYERARSQLLERLAQHAFILGNYQKVQEIAHQGLVLNEFNEYLHTLMLQSIFHQGHSLEAQRYYQHIQRLLQEELQTELSPQLKALSEQLQQRQSGDAPADSSEWGIHASLQVPFVGREKSLNQLRQFYNQRKNMGIIGESGSGKTRLIQEFVSQIHPRPRLMVANCKLNETKLPMYPLSDILRQHVKPQEWQALKSVWTGQLLRLLPELQTIRPGLEIPTIPTDPAQAQVILMEAIRQVFLSLSQSQSIFLVLDDAQWVDDATLSTFIYLHSRAPFDQDSCIAIIARSEELNPSLEKMTLSLQDDQRVGLVRLSGLQEKDVAELTRLIVRKTPSTGFLHKLRAGTGGNTLFVLESLRAILEENHQADFTTSTEIPLSKNLLSLIQNRIYQLSPEARDVLEVAAILGSAFDIHMLTQVSLLAEADIVQALEELEKRTIIQATPVTGGHAQYHFIHDKFCEALLESMSAARATVLHVRVADWLSESYHPGQAAVLAQHKQAAGILLEAFHYWIEAGIYARSLFAKEEAQDAFTQAGDLIQHIENELSDQDIYRLFDPWCEMSAEVFQTEQVKRRGNQLLQLGKKRNSPLLTGTALDTLSDGALMENKFQEGLEYTIQAIPHLEKSGNIFELMEAHIHRGVFLYMQAQFKPAIASFDQALVLGRDHNGPLIERAKANAHYHISLLHSLAGWPERSLEHAKLALEMAEKNRLHYYQASAFLVLTLSNYYLAEMYQAQNFARTGIDLAERIQGWRVLGYLTGFAASIDLSLGAIDSALAQAQKAIELGERTGLSDVLAVGCRHAGDIFSRLHDPETAIQYYRRGAESTGEHFLSLDNLIRLGYVQCMIGEVQTGNQTLATTLALSQSYELGLGIIISEFFQSLAYLRQGEFAKSRLLATKVKKDAKRQNLPTYYYDAIAILASLALEEGDLETARGHAIMAAEEARLRGVVWSELNALTLLNQVNQQMDHADHTSARRIQAIMATLRANAHHESLVGIFTAFKASYFGL